MQLGHTFFHAGFPQTNYLPVLDTTAITSEYMVIDDNTTRYPAGTARQTYKNWNTKEILLPTIQQGDVIGRQKGCWTYVAKCSIAISIPKHCFLLRTKPDAQIKFPAYLLPYYAELKRKLWFSDTYFMSPQKILKEKLEVIPEPLENGEQLLQTTGELIIQRTKLIELYAELRKLLAYSMITGKDPEKVLTIITQALKSA